MFSLQEFLFGKGEDNKLVNQGWNPHLEDKIAALQNQVNSLQQKIIQLEQNQRLNFKDAIHCVHTALRFGFTAFIRHFTGP